MSKGIRMSLGDKERIISSEELTRFEQLLHLDKIAPGRCSQLLIAELMLWNEFYGHEPFQVTDQIKALENTDSTSTTKPPTEFRRKPLKGLWHKHFFDAHFVGHNLSNEWKAGKKLENMIKEVFESAESEVITEDMMSEVSHRLIQGAMESRDEEKRLTGEWIVFDKHDDGNRYLCLARHADGDEAIHAKLKALVFPEYPDMFNKYDIQED